MHASERESVFDQFSMLQQRIHTVPCAVCGYSAWAQHIEHSDNDRIKIFEILNICTIYSVFLMIRHQN